MISMISMIFVGKSVLCGEKLNQKLCLEKKWQISGMVGHTFQKIYDISDDENQLKELLSW